MTSRQWAEIAIAFDTPPGERTERQGWIAYMGLCAAVEHVSGQNIYDEMFDFLGRSVIGEYRTPRTDTLRASLAALFAAMTQAERREVLGDF